MRKALFFLLIIGFAFNQSCIRPPYDEASSQMLSPDSIHQTIETAFSDTLFERGHFPPQNWWEMFRDAQLAELIVTALEENPTLKKMQTRIQRAQEEANIKKSTFFPTIGFSASVDPEYYSSNGFFRAYAPSIPGGVTEYEVGLNFSYEFDFWGKNRNLFRAALGIARAETAEFAQSKLIITTLVASTYFKLQSALARLNLLERQKKILTQLLDLENERLSNALNNQIALLPAKQRLFLLNQNLSETQQNISIEKDFLKALIGKGPDWNQKIEQRQMEYIRSFFLPSTVATDLLARRPDLMASIWRVQSAAELVGAAQADFYPSINLMAFAGIDTVFINKFFKWASRTGYVNPALTLPIFTGGKLTANLNAHRAEFHEAIQTYNELLLVALREVADQIAVLKAKFERLKNEDWIVETKKENQHLVSLRHQYALDNVIQVLNAEDELITEQLKQVQLQYETHQATIQLIKALGGGYHYQKEEQDPCSNP